MLTQDSDPTKTAAFLKGVITEHGDQGRGDVADLLGRFHSIDPDKAKVLHGALKQASGEDLPFRVAPLGQGFREPTLEEKLAAAPKSPFGSADGADMWQAEGMAKALLKRGNYQDPIKHFFKGEMAKNDPATMPYLAAVHDVMRQKAPEAAMKFSTQMKDAGLAKAEAPQEGTQPKGSVLSMPIPPTATPGPIPPPRPGETDIRIPAENPAPTATAPQQTGLPSSEGPNMQPSATPHDSGTGKIDVDKITETINNKARPGPTNKCATHAREALEAGGVDTSGHPQDAKDYGPTLEKNSFKPVDDKDYMPKKGDVVVIQPYEGGNPSGHIAIFNGKEWVSDTKQRDMWGGHGCRKHQPPHIIYRRD